MNIRAPSLILLVFAAFHIGVANGAEDEDDEFRPGLIATFSDDRGESIQRVDRTISFVWQSYSPDRRLSNGRFSASWQGLLMSQAPGAYKIYAYVSGDVQIKLKGETVLSGAKDAPAWVDSKPIELPFGWHPLEVTFRKTNKESRLSLYWSGPQFQLEPIGPRQFYHDPEKTPRDGFERGGKLVRALRCSACHDIDGEPKAIPAPELTNAAGNLHWKWLVDRLVNHELNEKNDVTLRRMPDFGLSRDDASALAEFLLQAGKPAAKRKVPKGDRRAGEKLALTLGCLACHHVGELGESGLFGGGDLTRIAEKRPADFFAQWLTEPAKINRQHRMPFFALSAKERNNLAAYLSTLGSGRQAEPRESSHGRRPRPTDRGRELFVKTRCAACHTFESQLPDSPTVNTKRLDHRADWRRACTSDPEPAKNRPGYRLSPKDRRAVQQFITAVSKAGKPAQTFVDGRQFLDEHNCTSCHARHPTPGLAPKLTKVATVHPQLATLVPAMTPPPLDSVGDKLHDEAMAAVISRTGKSRREWLNVRMPKFNLSDKELKALIKYFVDADRIPPRPQTKTKQPNKTKMQIAGSTLVTTAGFGCTSCHQVGDVLPPDAPLNARGADLSMLGTRIRREWFDRWVRNPSRIVPRMEMPSVQLPVRGVLDGKLDHQLAAVWHVLNRPDFQPPLPNPVRIVSRGGGRDERAAVLTDVLQAGEKTFVKPLLIGLGNRQSVLFDLETCRMAAWWVGDVARQHTKGKTWFWEAGGVDLLRSGFDESDLSLIQNDSVFTPTVTGQFVTETDQWKHVDGGISFDHRLVMSDASGTSDDRRTIQVSQSVTEASDQDEQLDGFRREITVHQLQRGASLRLRVFSKAKMTEAIYRDDGREATVAGVRIKILAPAGAKLTREGVVTSPAVGSERADVSIQLEYLTPLSVGTRPVVNIDVPPPKSAELNVVPGYEAIQLPIAEDLMPTALAWQPDGTLIVTSLKGRVWLARDTNGDELEDRLQVFSDDLAAPYGVVGYGKHIDVINKYALLRLFDEDEDGHVERTVTLASGWGHTTDYHDWVVGLPRDEDGNYYVAIPCQQDNRSPAAARFRGTVLKLVPRKPTPDDPRQFGIKLISGGHRFPMGIARNREGAMFVTDNQGNYNPFNELNHVVQGARYGFINAVERTPDFKPPLTPPAIDLPHPWTRSVNGICFLETPPQIKQKLGRNLFGPFEGHLIGCEYDTRRLIRMSLQRVGDTYQGAAYPFTLDKPVKGPPLLGPLVCAVAPDGDLYIGSIRDSGWGGSNNIGSLVRLRPKEHELPPGIAEVRATKSGFTIDFTAPIDRKRATDVGNYLVSSYTRVSTPAYGGPDKDRRQEKIATVEVSDDGKSVNLTFDELRIGFVYEFRLKNLTTGKLFHPAEAYFTLRRLAK